jgi:serine/threonine protein kinase
MICGCELTWLLFSIYLLCCSQGSTTLRDAVRPVLLELSAVIRVNHPKIVGFLGVVSFFPDETQKEPAELGLLFEFCDNGNLFENLHKKRTLSALTQRLDIACQISEGMEYLHTLSIIHRDLNSNNVVLTKAMDAKICDFGCARTIGAQGHITPTTISGSPSYMSPEQLTGSDKLTLQSDVWAMAVVVWELVSIRSPWVAIASDVNDTDVLSDMIVTQGQRLPPIPDHCLPDLARLSISNLLDASFAEEPTLRPSMKQFGATLRSILEMSDPAKYGQSTNLDGSVPAQAERKAPSHVLVKTTSFVSTAAHHDRDHTRPSVAERASDDDAMSSVPEKVDVGEVRGICPICSEPVSSLHIGRVRDSDGDYYHFGCWETLGNTEDSEDRAATPAMKPEDVPIQPAILSAPPAASSSAAKTVSSAAPVAASQQPKAATASVPRINGSWNPATLQANISSIDAPRAAEMVRAMPPRVKEKGADAGASTYSASGVKTGAHIASYQQLPTTDFAARAAVPSQGYAQALQVTAAVASVSLAPVYLESGGATAHSQGIANGGGGEWTIERIAGAQGGSLTAVEYKGTCPVCGLEVTSAQLRKRDSTGTRYVHKNCFELHEAPGLAVQQAAPLASRAREPLEQAGYWQGAVQGYAATAASSSVAGTSGLGGDHGSSGVGVSYAHALGDYLPDFNQATAPVAPFAYSESASVAYVGAQHVSSSLPPAQYTSSVQYSSDVQPMQYSSSGQYSSDVQPMQYTSSVKYSSDVQPMQYSSSGQYSNDVQPMQYTSSVKYSSDVQPMQYSSSSVPYASGVQYMGETSSPPSVQYTSSVQPLQYSSSVQYSSDVQPMQYTSNLASAQYSSMQPVEYPSSVHMASSTQYSSGLPYSSSLAFASTSHFTQY